MKKILIYTVVIAILSISCNNEDRFVANTDISERESIDSIEVNNGFLSFRTESAFKSYIDAISKDDVKTRSARSFGEGFKPISVIEKNTKKLRSAMNDDGIDEMTIDEYNIMKAKNLLFDDVLTEVLDTTLRIGIGDRVFKITKYGTFSAPKNKSANIDTAIENFDTLIIHNNLAGEYLEIGNDVTFVNTFGHNSVKETIYNPVHQKKSEAKSTVSVFSGDLHNGYNVESHNWSNNSLWQKFWDIVRGKDVSKENYFNSNRRIQVSVFDTNYGFYASTGIKVKMQKRMKIWFIKYWVGTEADKLAIGFNKVYGKMVYNNPRSFSTIMPTNSSYWSSFTGALNNQMSKFVYGQYKDFDIVKDWVEDIYMFTPDVSIAGYNFPNIELANKLYDAPADEVLSFLKSQTNKLIYTPIQKRIQPKDPRISYLVWGNSTTTFSEDKSYIYGVQEYGRSESKTVRFDRSFGFNFNNGTISGFVPTEFNISEIDAFGAAFFDNQWKGVRFTR